MTQEDKVIRSLRRGPKTARHLETKLGLACASAVISNLRNKGYDIVSHPIQDAKRDEPRVRYEIY